MQEPEKEGRKVTDTATGAAEKTLATLSGSLDTAGEAAHSTGMAVRDRFRDSARALERGGNVLRTSGISGAAAAAALTARRHKKALIGTAGAIAGGLFALGLVRRVRGDGANSSGSSE